MFPRQIPRQLAAAHLGRFIRRYKNQNMYPGMACCFGRYLIIYVAPPATASMNRNYPGPFAMANNIFPIPLYRAYNQADPVSKGKAYKESRQAVIISHKFGCASGSMMICNILKQRQKISVNQSNQRIHNQCSAKCFNMLCRILIQLLFLNFRKTDSFCVSPP